MISLLSSNQLSAEPNVHDRAVRTLRAE